MLSNTSGLSAGKTRPVEIESDEEFDDTGIDTPRGVRDRTFESLRTTIVPLNEVSTNRIARIATPKHKGRSNTNAEIESQDDTLIKTTKLISEDNKVNTPVGTGNLISSPSKLSFKPLAVPKTGHRDEEFDDASDESPIKSKKSSNQTTKPEFSRSPPPSKYPPQLSGIRTPTAKSMKRSFSDYAKPVKSPLDYSVDLKNLSDIADQRNNILDPVDQEEILLNDSPIKRQKVPSFHNNSQIKDFQLADEDISRASILERVNQTLESIHQPSRFLGSPGPQLSALPLKKPSVDPSEPEEIIREDAISTSDDELERIIDKYKQNASLKTKQTEQLSQNHEELQDRNIDHHYKPGNTQNGPVLPKAFLEKPRTRNLYNSPNKSSPLKYQTSPLVESTPKDYNSKRSLNILPDINETSREISKGTDQIEQTRGLKHELSDEQLTKLYSLLLKFTKAELINSTWLLNELKLSKDDLADVLEFLTFVKKKNERTEKLRKKKSY